MHDSGLGCMYTFSVSTPNSKEAFCMVYHTWIISRRLPPHMQFPHGPLLIISHARQSSANLFRQPEPLWTSTDHELMRGCLQLVMHVAWTSTAARPCAMQHVDFQRALVMRAGSLTRSQISRIDSPPLRPPRGLQPELW